MSLPSVEQLLAENNRLREENLLLKQENKLLRQKVDLLVRRVFGSKSEKIDANQLELVLGGMEASGVMEPKPDDTPPDPPTPSRKKNPRKPRYPEDLPTETEVLDPEEVTENPDAWRMIREEISEQLDFEPGRFLRRLLVRRVWTKRDDPDHPPVIAPLPPKLQERSILAPGLLAHILVSKYADHLPLYRLEQIFHQRHGVSLPRQTMARGVECAADWLKPIVEEMVRQQLDSGYLQIDETPTKYLKPGTGSTGQGYFWTMNAPGIGTVFRWSTGRGHDNLLAAVPETFEGIVQCDGYSAYEAFGGKRPEIKIAGCWAHVRRKFEEAFKQNEAVAHNAWFIRQIGHLYTIERRLRKARAGPNLRGAIRQSESRPILRRIKFMLMKWKAAHLPQSLTGKAISYALGQWPLLEVYVEHPRVQIDNNLVENSIRPVALGRKNWLFIGHEVAGWRSAVIYSLILSCKAQGVEPYAYLKDVLERIPSMTNHQVPSLTPREWAKAQRARLASAA